MEAQELELDFSPTALGQYKILNQNYEKQKKPKTPDELINLSNLLWHDMAFLVGCDKVWHPPTPSTPGTPDESRMATRSSPLKQKAGGARSDPVDTDASLLNGPLAGPGDGGEGKSDDDDDDDESSDGHPVSQHRAASSVRPLPGPSDYQDFSTRWIPGHCMAVTLFELGNSGGFKPDSFL